MAIHPSAIVDRGAELDTDVEIGPFCHVQAGVRVGKGTRLISHVVLSGKTTIGAGNVFHPFTVIGGDAQVKKGMLSSARGELRIGDQNVFRESVTVNVSSGGSSTSIGSHNLFMAAGHIAHDVRVGSHCVIANGVQIAGHVDIADWVTFGGLSGVAQHLRVGQSAFVAAGAMCERDVAPFVIAQGDRARVRALNVVGLERRGVPAESIAALRRAFKDLFGKRPLLEVLPTISNQDPWVAILTSWLADPARGERPAQRGVSGKTA